MAKPQKEKNVTLNRTSTKKVDFTQEASGTKREMHVWQHERILEYKANHEGKRPPIKQK